MHAVRTAGYEVTALVKTAIRARTSSASGVLISV